MSSISKIQDLPEVSPSLSTPSSPVKAPLSFLDSQFKQFSKNLIQDKEDRYIVPQRRICAFSGIDSDRSFAKALSTVFISKKEIIGAPHAMKFLPSPFPAQSGLTPEEEARLLKRNPALKRIIEQDKLNVLKQQQAVAITKEGKHVILQQGMASCVPSSVAMLILDRGGKPEYSTIRNIHFATNKDAISWFKDAGFSTKITELSGTSNERLHTLSACLKKYGPGALGINDHEGIYGHEIVLDDISLESGTATIRDPFHGWQIDIALSALQRISPNTFIQITGKIK